MIGQSTSPVADRTVPAQGVGTGEADLWCTYAAVRTLAWLGRLDAVPNRAGTIDFLLSRANSDGGYAWTRGMSSDAWATFYCVQALTDLGDQPPRLDRTADWLRDSWSGDAYAMMPGQQPDVWATHFSTRTAIDVCRIGVPSPARLAEWLRGLQSADGGLAWSPSHAVAGSADVRATCYGVKVWDRLNAVAPTPLPWHMPSLVAWLRDQQGPDGGYRFAADSTEPCSWATYRAASALAVLGEPVDKSAVAWLVRNRLRDRGFVRWSGYPVADVWSTFCAAGTFRAAGIALTGFAAEMVSTITGFACPQGGFTYREPRHAADVLSTAATVLAGEPDPGRLAELRAWLSGCQLPNEGGLMYMPARGAEVRSTLWALAAGALAGDSPARARIATWLRGLQNPDGGFGPWAGRASDMVSTVAAVDTVRLLGLPVGDVLDTDGIARFVASCRDATGFRPVPGSGPTFRAGSQALRVLAALGRPRQDEVETLLARHRVAGGGFANTGNRVPDLLSGYEAVLVSDQHRLPLDVGHLRRFVDRISTSSSFTWSPLAPQDGGGLAHCLGSLLRGRLPGRTELPPIVLS